MSIQASVQARNHNIGFEDMMEITVMCYVYRINSQGVKRIYDQPLKDKIGIWRN